MRVLERLNVVPVARTRMSDDGRVLVVERFDVDEQGAPTHGLEDACGLLGLPPHEKYATTTEKVLNATRAYLQPAAIDCHKIALAPRTGFMQAAGDEFLAGAGFAVNQHIGCATGQADQHCA